MHQCAAAVKKEVLPVLEKDLEQQVEVVRETERKKRKEEEAKKVEEEAKKAEDAAKREKEKGRFNNTLDAEHFTDENSHGATLLF